MSWTWENEKSLGLRHLDHMAELIRGFERNYREYAERDTAMAEKYAREAETYERAAAEVRAANAAPALERPFTPSLMCGIATGSGLPCSRRVEAEGDRCWQHDREEASE